MIKVPFAVKAVWRALGTEDGRVSRTKPRVGVSRVSAVTAPVRVSKTNAVNSWVILCINALSQTGGFRST